MCLALPSLPESNCLRNRKSDVIFRPPQRPNRCNMSVEAQSHPSLLKTFGFSAISTYDSYQRFQWDRIFLSPGQRYILCRLYKRTVHLAFHADHGDTWFFIGIKVTSDFKSLLCMDFKSLLYMDFKSFFVQILASFFGFQKSSLDSILPVYFSLPVY